MTTNGNLPRLDAPTVTLTKAELDNFRARYDQLVVNEETWRNALESAIFTAIVVDTTGADDDEWLDAYVRPRVRKWAAEIVKDKDLRTPGQRDCPACNATGNREQYGALDGACTNCEGQGAVEQDGGPPYSTRPISTRHRKVS